MKLNCCDMVCPKPVLETKKALEDLPNNSILDIELNSIASIENVKRFLTNQGYEFNINKQNNITVISIVKGFECAIVPDNQDKFLDKSIFIKDDKVGDGELGKKLIIGFLKTTLEFDKLPKNIILVNRGVFLTTKNQDSIKILKEFIKRGVKIYSCGLCMEHYKIDPSELIVGEIGNAYDTMDMLLHTQTITL
jgi:selenium metabolism protein YedF